MADAVAVVGPTATGKSDLGIRLAAELDGEVVNADAMQLYRGMDIGTAKVPPQQRQNIPHHLLDVLDVTESASVAAYQRDARSRIADIRDRGRTPVLVGGSGLYVRSVVDDLRFPGTDPELRATLAAEAEQLGNDTLHRRLARYDPEAAASILPSNTRRVVRALEVIEITGRPFSANLPTPGPPLYGMRLIGLDQDTAQLDTRVDSRVQRMFAAGLVTEVRRLLEGGLRRGPTAARALGYQQVLAAIDGAGDFAAAASETAQATRRFVRKQRKWFRRDTRIEWFDAGSVHLADEVLTALRQ